VRFCPQGSTRNFRHIFDEWYGGKSSCPWLFFASLLLPGYVGSRHLRSPCSTFRPKTTPLVLTRCSDCFSLFFPRLVPTASPPGRHSVSLSASQLPGVLVSKFINLFCPFVFVVGSKGRSQPPSVLRGIVRRSSEGAGGDCSRFPPSLLVRHAFWAPCFESARSD